MNLGLFDLLLIGESLTSLRDAIHSIKSITNAAIVKISDLLCDLEGLQKTSLALHALLELASVHKQKPILAKFRASLNIANSFDFYGFLKIPYQFLDCVEIEKIDEQALLNSVETILCHQWLNRDQDPAVRTFAERSIRSVLEQLADSKMAYVKTKDLKKMLQNWMVYELAHPEEVLPVQWRAPQVDFTALSIIHQPSSFLQKTSVFLFTKVDLLCLPAFFGEWEIINLETISKVIGRYRPLAWMTRYSLDELIRIELCAGFLVQFIEACHALSQAEISSNEKKRAQWDLVVSATEFIFNFSALCKMRAPCVYFLTFVAKSTGVLCILFCPERLYFDRE